MPRVLHRIALNELVMVVHLDLIERVQRLIIALVIASANQVELLRVRVLYTLEIMRKTAIVVRLHFDGLNGLVPNVQLINVLRVFLQEVDHLNCWSCVPVSTHVKDRPLLLLHHGLPHGRCATCGHEL